jgi:hypothetical protein
MLSSFSVVLFKTAAIGVEAINKKVISETHGVFPCEEYKRKRLPERMSWTSQV